MEVKLANGVKLEYVGGKLVLSAEVAALAIPALDNVKAKIEAGEIDPVKGTNLDAEAMIMAIEFLKKELVK